MSLSTNQKRWDVFVSYASEDRETVARPLAHRLDDLGLRVWFDAFELRLGDRLSERIAEGLRESRYGVVILSPSFFQKKWTRNELGALLAVEAAQDKLLLPIWHGVSEAEVRTFSPILADRVALKADEGLNHVAYEISEIVGRPADNLWSFKEDLAGLWHGQSGRLLLANDGALLVGDYDWFGKRWAGRIIASRQGDLLRFDWTWRLSPDAGRGFFRLFDVNSRGFRTMCLAGGWLYERDVDRLEEAVATSESANKLFWENAYYGGSRDVPSWMPDIVHPWSFSIELIR